jgi:predicted nucleic acid-binding protein
LTVLPRILAVLHQFAITNDIIDVAARLPGASLRSLDALHLATAEAVRPALAWFVTYDKRLAEAASQHGFAVAAPELA